MLYLRRPSDAAIRDAVRLQAGLPFTYPEVGASRTHAPDGYPLNHHLGLLGHGRDVYEQARAALDAWAMYDLPWTTVHSDGPPDRTGLAVGVLVRHVAFWSLNCARVVYLVREEGEVARHGFAIGTLPMHAERGEERFTVEHRSEDDSVWFEIFTFAGPGNVLVRIGYPVMRWVQHRFGRDAVAAMQRAVQGRH